MNEYNISKAFEEIENELIDSMMRNFSRHRAEELKEGYNWTQWQAEQLKSLEQYRKQNFQKFNKQFSELNDKVEKMLRTARADGNASQEAKILQAIKDGFKIPEKPSETSIAEFFKVNDRKLNALIKSTTDDLKSAETAVLRMSNDKYRSAIFNAQVYANSGAGTYEKAVDMACRDMLRAGLNCVEYKNGARHTLSDYAEMAIRTANKRAYLRGEGEKRQEFGITTVVVNSRQGGCPDCAPYIGRVFIDDVYSGGSAKDGKYPLLSEAISGGLFHPRCKDSTSTYYESITTLKPATEDEIDDMKRQEALEQQKSYCENQAEKCGRISKYSLDSDNKRVYAKRAEVWQDKAEQTAEKLDETVAKSGGSGIIKEDSKKPITKITDNSINRVPRVSVSGYTEEQCTELQRQHKELLKYARDNNDSKEVAFVFRKDLTDRDVPIKGTDDKLDFGTSLFGKGEDLIILHNHPRNGSFSTTDIEFFCCNKFVKTITIVKNNGKVEVLTKSTLFDSSVFATEYRRLYSKVIKSGTDYEKDRLVKTLLTKTKSGVIWIEK